MALRVAVFGAGAVGSFYGARLSDGGADVSLIGRGRQLEACRSVGLTIVEPERTRSYRLPATDDPADVGPVDVVLFTVKSYDTVEAAGLLRPLLREDTAVISLQNGIDNEDRIGEVIGREHVLGGAAYILAAVREPGIVDAAGPRGIVIGELTPGEPSARVRALSAVGQQANLDVRASDDVRVALWEKYVLLVAFSAMTGTTRLPIGAIREAPAARAMLHAIMSEVWAVGRASGVPLADDLVERQMALLTSQDADATTSLYHDLEAGHRTELESLQGAAMRLGREHGVPTPGIDAAYAIIQPWALRFEAAAADRAPIPA